MAPSSVAARRLASVRSERLRSGAAARSPAATSANAAMGTRVR